MKDISPRTFSVYDDDASTFILLHNNDFFDIHQVLDNSFYSLEESLIFPYLSQVFLSLVLRKSFLSSDKEDTFRTMSWNTNTNYV